MIDARDHWPAVLAGGANHSVANSLMRPSLVVVGDELTNDVVEMLKAKDDEVVQRFMFETLNPPLDEGVGQSRQLHLICAVASERLA